MTTQPTKITCSEHENSLVQVDFARLRENATWWRRLVSTTDDTGQHSERDTELCAVVKADGYGVGAATVARAALAGGAEMLAVFSSEQARSLLTQGFTCPILILGPGQLLDVTSPMSSAAASGQLHFTLHDEGQAGAISDAAMSLRCVVSVHLQIDTGMTRGGFTQEQALTLLDSLEQYPGLRVVGMSTHLATADGDPDFAAEQLSRFDLASKNLFDSAAGSAMSLSEHVANTCAALRSNDFRGHMVRVGLGLHGFGTEQLVGEPQLERDSRPMPALRWVSKIVHMQCYSEGVTVGYGQTHTLSRDSLLGIVPVGYADGYPLSLSNRGAVVRLESDALSNVTHHAPVLGRVNMDQIVIDLTDAPPALVQSEIRVVLIHDDPESPCSVPALAQLANSSAYEILCRISPRVRRVVINEM